MAWPPSTGRLLQFAVLATLAGEMSYAAAEVLILRADGPTARRQFRIGARMPDASVFNLRVGDSVTVLARGGTRRFRGPGAFSVTAPPQGYVTTLNGVRVRIQSGAVRDPPRVAGVQPTDVWEYDSREEGRACVLAGSRPVLWRPGDSGATRITISTLAGVSQSFDWPAGQTRFAWPETIPIANGSTYTLSWNSNARPVRVTTVILPTVEADSLDALATALIRNRCSGQVDTFIATRVDPDAPVVQPGTQPASEPPRPR